MLWSVVAVSDLRSKCPCLEVFSVVKSAFEESLVL